MSSKIILLGGGGHCKSCIDVIEQEKRFIIAGIIETNSTRCGNVLDYPIIGTDANLPDLIKQYSCLVTVGHIQSAATRLRLYQTLIELQAAMPVIISPLAYVSQHATIGSGSIIMHGAFINAGAKIGANCIINSKAIVEHDATIDDHCHISTGAIINGGTVIEQQTFIGSQAVTREYITIGKQSLIGAGVTVMKNLAPGSFVKRNDAQ